MKGQWLGKYQSNTTGDLLVDIDEFEGRFYGYAVLRPEQAGMPIVFTRFVLETAEPRQVITTSLFALDPNNLEPVNWNAVQQHYPGVVLYPNAEVTLLLNGDELEIDWKSEAKTLGHAKLPRSKAGTPSTLKPIAVANWKEFKDYVDELPPYKFVFRGQQSNQWRLRTAFHRTGRANLERYSLIDIPAVSKNLSAQTKHLFDLKDALQYGAFVSLIQHHGYPTPLLDWTHSPYVAGFFGYRGLQTGVPDVDKSGKIRIFQFALHDWQRLPQLLKLSPIPPHFSILDALAIENARMLPQQAISTITNVDDIETYISNVEIIQKQSYLQAIDLPISERPKVARDLAVMGITAGSLLPGLDGACEQLRERYFPS